MIPPVHRLKAIGLGGSLVALALVAAAPVRAQDGAGDFDPDNTEWNGLSELVAIASEHATLVVTRSLDASTLHPTDAVILVAPREAPVAEPLIALMQDGGRVVIADDFGAGNGILETFHIERRAPTTSADVLRLRGNPALLVAHPAMQHPLTVGVDALVTNHPQVAVHHPDPTRTIDRGGPLPPIFEIAEGEGLVLAGAVGAEPHQGRLIVLSDPSVLINNMLEMRGNRRFAENLVGFVAQPDGRVILVPPDGHVVGHYGENVLADPLTSLRELLDVVDRASLPPAALRVLVASLAAILLLFAAGVLPKASPYGSASFAPRPAAEGGFVGRVGWYAARAGDLTEPFLVYKFELETELHARLGLSGRSSVNDVVQAMQKRGLTAAEVGEARGLLGELSRTADRAERNVGDHPVSEAQLRGLVARGEALLARVGRREVRTASSGEGRS